MQRIKGIDATIAMAIVGACAKKIQSGDCTYAVCECGILAIHQKGNTADVTIYAANAADLSRFSQDHALPELTGIMAMHRKEKMIHG